LPLDYEVLMLVQVHRDPCAGEMFNDATRAAAPVNACIDSLESTARPRSDDDSQQLADRISCLESDLVANTYQLKALREEAGGVIYTASRKKSPVF